VVCFQISKKCRPLQRLTKSLPEVVEIPHVRPYGLQLAVFEVVPRIGIRGWRLEVPRDAGCGQQRPNAARKNSQDDNSGSIGWLRLEHGERVARRSRRSTV